MISAQAVEAAARVHQDLQARRGHPTWDELGEIGAHGQQLRMEYMRAALEAAAPHMLAEAWDEGGRAATGTYDTGYPSRNPYRTPDAR